MRIYKTGFILLLSFILIACSRSPSSQFYILNPLPPQKTHARNLSHLRIGIEPIGTPAYFSKPELIIHDTAHRVELKEFHRWVDALDKNIRRVIETNLRVLLPGAVVEGSPWNMKLKPNYQLHIDISQFEVDIQGNSLLRANYIIYSEEQIIKRGNLYYHLKIPKVTVEALVGSMNTNLAHLTKDIAREF